MGWTRAAGTGTLGGMEPHAEPSPLDTALARLGKLTTAGRPADQVAQEVGALVAGWAEEPEMDAATAQARLAEMWDSIGRDAADLEEAISDSGGADGPALTQARAVLAAMQAAVTALAAAHARLDG